MCCFFERGRRDPVGMSWLKKWRLLYLYSVREHWTLCVEEHIGGGIAYTCLGAELGFS